MAFDKKTYQRVYQRVYQKARYHRFMARAKELLGGVCAVCGAKDGLEFDHIVPESKQYEISDCWCKPTEVSTAELAKCQLLCAACHDLKSAAEGSFSTNHMRGSAHPLAKLNDVTVRLIRQNKEGLSQRLLARKFSVSRSLVYQVQHNKIWTHVV